ncbi:MAG: hypothetical protein HY608_11080, partial [Planctomycetes bacterium]|nr:hypothetical protein [Planctomycetota bacterium]
MIRWLLGLEPAAFAANTSWSVSTGWPRAGVLLALLAAGGVALGLYLRERALSSRPLAVSLAVLRAGVLAIVVSYLADTRMVLTRRESRQTVVKVLVDRSLSMTVPGLEYSRPED